MSTLSNPSLWKIGRIIPILKPNKSQDQSTSYRPISLLSPLAKLTEKLVLGTLTEHLELAEHVMVALDLSRVFDTVNIGILETTLPPTIKRWL